jgi:hypothetical protein
MTPERPVYARDRSFYSSRPNNEPKKLHRESPIEPGMAACDRRYILLDMDRPQDEDKVRAETPTALCRRCFPVSKQTR